MSFHKIVSVLTLTCLLRVQAIVTDEQYASIPPVFYLDDFDNCMRYGEKALFCYATIQVFPKNPANTSNVWNIISELMRHPNNYRHDKLRHGYCINVACPELSENITAYQNDNDLLKKDLAECMNRKYGDLGLKSTITEKLMCETFYQRPLDVYDYAGGIFLLLLIAVVIWGTFYEGLPRYKSKEEYKRITSTKFGKILSSFSVVKNWERLGSENNNPDGKSLRVVNGIRVYNIVMVMLAHACLVGFAAPVSNPVFVEQVAKNLETLIAVNGYYAIQSFFVVSGWLLCYHFFLMCEEKKEIKFSYILLAFVNRYIRLTPAYLVMIVFNATWLQHLNRGPVWHKMIGYENENCRKNWWANLLYINNFYDPEHMCIQQSWYLATDTQLFLVSLFILTVMLKYKKFIKHILGTCLAISVIVPALMTYISDYDIVVRQYPENFYTIFLDLIEWHVMYASPFVNFGGYMIGMIFGYLFYRCRNKIVFTEKWHVVLWWVLTFSLPLATVYIGIPIYQNDEKPHIILCAIYAGLAKVVFALGIAIGMFGVTQNIGWFIRYCTIWRPIQILGRLTYCVFLVHTSVIRLRGAIERGPAYMSVATIFFHTFGDYSTSLIFALVLCLAIELPISALQKVFIPQLENKRAGHTNKNVQQDGTNGDIVNNDEKLTKV